MNRFRASLQTKPLQLFVSLPANDPALAKAALAEGADGLKAHINVDHRASGRAFGPLEHGETAIREIRSLFDGPFGIVPGGSLTDVKPEEIDRLAEIGIDFYSIYGHHMPAFLVRDSRLARTFAVDAAFDIRLANAARPLGMEAVEASVVPGGEYGTPLSFADLLKYRTLANVSELPLIVPSQRRLEPEDVPSLADCGARVILIGAVVTGTGEDGIRRAVSRFREAIDRLGGKTDGAR
ncbi:hypothetical protein ACFQWB_10255 [Paenibacillus thermoaerophilus]|uniref:Uncharacterized protein n=1 Tax=Paenibacillus thermoaerophilus TaxID=1215385 RepID=A0ABW2V486_9BACL|nr:hypothetical protein [Paenibacillus thermoaerophilus]TMV18839.1 hypothetical protein FE781_02630 [Paenibacillus thermoaerophilus]